MPATGWWQGLARLGEKPVRLAGLPQEVWLPPLVHSALQNVLGARGRDIAAIRSLELEGITRILLGFGSISE